MNSRRSFLSSLLAAALTPALRFLPTSKVEPSVDYEALRAMDPLEFYGLLGYEDARRAGMRDVYQQVMRAWHSLKEGPYVIVSDRDLEEDFGDLVPGKLFRADGNYQLHRSDFGVYWTRTS